LRRIYPKVEAKGIHMKVPMPGYPFSEEGKKENYLKMYFLVS